MEKYDFKSQLAIFKLIGGHNLNYEKNPRNIKE